MITKGVTDSVSHDKFIILFEIGNFSTPIRILEIHEAKALMNALKEEIKILENK